MTWRTIGPIEIGRRGSRQAYFGSRGLVVSCDRRRRRAIVRVYCLTHGFHELLRVVLEPVWRS